MKNDNLKKRSRSPRFGFGLLLVITGIIVLALNFSARGADLRPILFSWQMLIFVLGLLFMIYTSRLSGAYLIIAAVFFAIPPLAGVFPDTFSWVQPDFLKTYWALLLVIAGIFVIIRRSCRQKQHWDTADLSSDWYRKYTYSGNGNGFICREIIFSGMDEIFNEPVFKGADLHCIFGGINLDLRQSTLPEGDTAVNVECVFGGVALLVPESWNVILRTDNIIGGASDSRIKNGEDTARRVIITGNCVFGGLEIK